MANYNVDIEVAIKHANSIDTLRKKIEALEKEYRKLGVGSKLEIEVELGGLKKELALHDEIEGRLKRRQRLEETISRQRSARIEREKSRLATFAAGLAPATTAPAGPDVALRSYQESIEKAVAAETQIRNLVNSTNMSYDLRRQQTERIGRQRREQMNMVDRELSFEKRLNATLERRGKIIDNNGKIRNKSVSGGGPSLAKRRNAALTAGAFPLLFGGGAFTSLGGAVGGAITGQLFGGATVALQVLGKALDNFTAQTAQLGQALNPLTADLGALIKASGNVNSETSHLIQQLEEAGQTSAALTLATQEMAGVIGADGVDALRTFGEDTVELGNEFSRAMTIMGAAIAGFINTVGVVKGVIGGLERMNLVSQVRGTLATPGTAKSKRLRETLVPIDEAFAQPGLERIESVQVDGQTFAITEKTRDAMREINQETQKRTSRNALILQQSQNLQSIEQQTLALRQSGLEVSDQEHLDASIRIANNEADNKVRIASLDLNNKLAATEAKRSVKQEYNNTLKKIETDRLTEILNLEKKHSDAVAREVKQAEAQTNREEAAAKRKAKQMQRAGEQQQKSLERAVALETRFAREVELREASTDFEKQMLKIRFDYEDRLGQIEKLEDKSLQSKQKALAVEIRSLDIAEAERKEAERLAKFATTLSPAEQESVDMERQLSLLNAQIQGREEEFLIKEKIAGLDGDELELRLNQLDVERELIAVREEQLHQQSELENLVNGMGRETLSLFEDLILATDDFNKSLADTLRSLATMVLRYGINAAAGADGAGFFSFLAGSLKFRANGGPVTGNRPYIVGERGPELFVPGASGNVVPNHAMGGANVTVNVDASGTQAQGNQPNAKLLGQAIGAAVQAELIKQKRPGGLLAA